jgi:hypothetical protein
MHRVGCEYQVYVGEIICKAQGCTTIACFGLDGEEEQFCKAHMHDGMVRTVTLSAFHLSFELADLRCRCLRWMSGTESVRPTAAQSVLRSAF